jgi:Flp pilus assembly protein CpaB
VEHILSNKVLSTRRGTMAVGIGAALLAAILLLVFLSRYKHSVNSASEPMTVLVAKSLIQKGTPGDVIGSTGLFQTSSVPRDELKDGAFVDPASLQGRLAVDDIYPGQQLTAASFGFTAPGAISNKLAKLQRAITLPLDSAHGMIGQIQSGDEVEVLGGFQVQRINPDGTPAANAATRPLLRVIVPKAFVLAAPGAADGGVGGGGAKNIVLRVTDRQAMNLAFASDNGRIWVALRPRTGARSARHDLVSLETLLLGVKPIQVQRSFGARR